MQPSYININDNTSFFNYYNHHEDPNLIKPEDMHSIMETRSYNNNPVILEKKCLPGKIRSSKKDRHSKINTARGPRDRRMRLSLDVAKKFFGLQDMLQFDKASNTIEWLMMKSKAAIQDLKSKQLNDQSCSIIGVSNSPSSASECEVLSDDNIIKKDKDKFSSCSSTNKEHKKVQRVRKVLYFDQSLAKETREKARARARKRTSEKRNIKLGSSYDVAAGCHQYSKLRPSLDQVMDHNTNRLGTWIPFGEIQVQLTDQITEYPSSHFQFKQGVVGDYSSMFSSNWSPSVLFNYQHNPALSNEVISSHISAVKLCVML